MVSQRKLHANRANAAKSTGPRTPQGKRKSAMNALTHGLFCQALLLEGEDPAAFQLIRRGFYEDLCPQSLFQAALADRIVAVFWKLRRLQAAQSWLHNASVHDFLQAYHQKVDELEQAGIDDPDSNPGPMTADEVDPAYILFRHLNTDNPALERFSRYEQRLEHTLHRTLRDYHAHRRSRRNKPSDDLADRSPYLPPLSVDEVPPMPPPAASSPPIAQNEPTAAPALPDVPPSSHSRPQAAESQNEATAPVPRSIAPRQSDIGHPPPLSASVPSEHQNSRNEPTNRCSLQSTDPICYNPPSTGPHG